MAHLKNAGQYFQGFSKLERHDRLTRLVEMGALTSDDVKFLDNGAKVKPELAEHLIENVIGYYQMPLGVATNFRIDDKDYVIPMAVEETSIIAAASKTAKWIRQKGHITTDVIGHELIGQIQFSRVKDIVKCKQLIEANKEHLIKLTNIHVADSMVKRGGGVTDIQTRELTRNDHQSMLVVHILVDTCDAMGANIINQICEFLKSPIEDIINETADMCILSNLNDKKLTRATVTINDIKPELGNKLAEASLFAELDPYRAATNNKGVLNAIDAILIATGNDWRAVEAGIHAYASRLNQYRSITHWYYENGTLTGTFKAPIIVGTVGGVTQLHPTAKLCLDLLGIENANELSRVIAAVGLVQNLGALTALSTVGIIEGHMKLHIANLTIGAGATGAEIPIVKKRLQEILTLRKRISLSHAIDVLKELRDQNTSVKPTASVEST